MEIDIKVVGDEDSELWNKLIASASHSTIFHTWEWLKVMEKHTWVKFMGKKIEGKLYPLIGFHGNEPVALFPIFAYYCSPFTILCSPPAHTDIPYMGPIFINFEQLRQNKRESLYTGFQESVEVFINTKLRASYISVLSVPHMVDARPFKWAGYQVEPLYTYQVDLKVEREKIWEGFDRGLKANLKKALKHISVVEGGLQDIKPIYTSLVERYRQQKITPRISLDFLLDLYNVSTPETMKILVAEHQGRYIGGLIALAYGDTTSAWIGTTKTQLRGLYPNELLHWKMIEWACEQGYKSYEIIWANTQRLCRFKSKFNPSLVGYFHATKYPNPLFGVLMELYAKLSGFKIFS